MPFFENFHDRAVMCVQNIDFTGTLILSWGIPSTNPMSQAIIIGKHRAIFNSATLYSNLS